MNIKNADQIIRDFEKVISKISDDIIVFNKKVKESVMGTRYLIRKNGGTMVAKVTDVENLDGRNLYKMLVEKSTITSITADSEVTMSDVELKYHIKLKGTR